MSDITKTFERATPFIRPIHTQGGTFYTFSSASEDLTLSFNTDSPRKFKFSKFALLNIPDFLTEDPVKNTVRLKAIPGAYQYVDFNRTTRLNHFLAESFQNYCLNLETMILSNKDYNRRNPLTVAERVFFKWLKELGALRFEQTNVKSINDIRYLEEAETPNVYNRVVQYIGDIDFVNNLSTQVNSYSEVYIHIPTEVGNFPAVYFKSIKDENYAPGMIFSRILDGPDNEFIYGRHYSDFNPAGLDTHAYYDNDIGLPNSDTEVRGRIYTQWKRKLGVTDYVIPEDYNINQWWYYPTNDTNIFYLEPNTFEDPTNDDLAISTCGDPNPDKTAIKFRRSRLDGISIDFDVNSYKDISENNINSLIDVAQSIKSQDFEFNAVLIYYDLYEDKSYTNVTISVEDGIEGYIDPQLIFDDSAPLKEQTILATNLFGVLFIDNVEDNFSLSGGYIPRFKKVRPNTVTKLNGNAYGLKLNMKLNVSPIDTGVEVETVISNSNTLSMDIYADALNALKRSAEYMESLIYKQISIDSRIIDLELWKKQFNPAEIAGLNTRITTLENTINSNANITNTSQDLLPLIERNYETITKILNDKTPITVSYDLGTFVPGVGITMDRSNPRQLVISSTNDNFNFQDKKEVSIYKDWDAVPYYLKGTRVAYTYEILLKPLKNYLRITDEPSFIPNKDIILYINDSDNSWQAGQILRLYFTNPLLMKNQFGNFDFYIYTDFLNKSRASDKYSALVAKISSSDFESRNFRPVIEIICTEPEHFGFFIDYL